MAVTRMRAPSSSPARSAGGFPFGEAVLPKWEAAKTPQMYASSPMRTRRDDVPTPPLAPKARSPVPAPTEPSSTFPSVARRKVSRMSSSSRHSRSIPFRKESLSPMTTGGQTSPRFKVKP